MNENIQQGDWLIPNGCEEPHQVRAISYQEDLAGKWTIITFEGNNDFWQVWYYPQSCKPVPITKEILENNGWRPVDGVCASICRHDGYNLSILHWAKPGINLTINKGGYGHNFVCMPIEYVHELQHALRLCGIKKEIVV